MRPLLTVQHLRFGGMERMVTELALGLAARGHEPTVVGLYPGGPFDAVLRDADVAVHTGLVERGGDPRAIARLAAVARAAGCDAALAATGGANHAPMVTLAAARRLGIACARWVHGTPVEPLAGTRRAMEAWMRRRDAGVVALTEAHATALARFWRIPRERIHVIPNGQELPTPASPETRAALRAELGIPAEAFVVGLVAAFRPVKRHEVLVRAVGALRERVPGLHLLLVGDGETREGTEAVVAELGLGDAVTFTGARTDAARLYGAMDLHVLCSYPAETFPLCVVEAMGAAVAPVATRVGGVPDIVEDGECGRLVEPESPAELAAAIRELAEDEALRTRLAEAARRRAVERFAREVMVERFEALLADLGTRRAGR